MVAASLPMQRLCSQIERIAPYFRTALITGETGTGKELVARALHALSPGAGGPFVVCNASAIVETLFESELFGHVKGAFTGATADRVGLFEAAHRGSLFLDEIGEMPLATQAKLLRALQSHEILRVGSTQTRRIETRIIAATNRDLKALTSTGQFRQDLFYRISMVELRVTPLRARLDDLAPLAHHFTRHFATQFNKPLHGISLAAIAVLRAHQWPGNIRELENILGSAAMQSAGPLIEPHDLPPLPSPSRLVAMPDFSTGNPPMRLDDLVQRHVRHVMHHCGGNKLRAAELLGVSRSTLYRMLDRA
jgi:transcriptional regulator with PAS, ATPase and Fis domain